MTRRGRAPASTAASRERPGSPLGNLGALMEGVAGWAVEDDDLDDDWDDEDDWDDDLMELDEDDPGEVVPRPLSAREVLSGVERSAAGDAAADQLVGLALESMNTRELREIAASLGWKLSGQRREDVQASLAAHYASPEATARARAGLRPADLKLLGLLRALQLPDSAELGAALTRVGRDAAGQGGVDWRKAWSEGRGRGLFLQWQGQTILPPRLVDGAACPTDAWLPPARDVGRLTVAPAPDPLRSLARWAEAIADVGESYRRRSPWARYEDVRVPANWEPGAPLFQFPMIGDGRSPVIPPVGAIDSDGTLKAIRRALGLHRDSAAQFMHALFLPLLNLAARGAGDGEEGPGRPGLVALGLALRFGQRDFLRLLVTLWQSLPYGIFDEWSWVQLEGRPAPFALQRATAWNLDATRFQDDLMTARQAIATQILGRLSTADAGQGGWLDLDAFLDLAAKATPESAMGGRGLWRMTGPLGEAPPAWPQGGGLVWRFVIEVPLHCLGLVDLARDKAGRLRALRLSDAGRRFMGPASPAEPAAPEASWSASRGLSLAVTLNRMPTLNAVHLAFALEDLRDGRAVFRLDQDACRQAFRAGAGAEGIERALATRRLNLPPAVLKTIARWEDAWGQWVLRTGWSLLTFADEATAREVLTGSAIEAMLVCRLSPTRYLVEPEAADEFLAALKRAGHRPMVREPAPEPDR